MAKLIFIGAVLVVGVIASIATGSWWVLGGTLTGVIVTSIF